MDFIHPSRSLGGAPVLFAHKKDGSLQLCVHFHGLNKIMKGWYPITMASNKVQVIQDWPEPWKIKDIQSFLGFANFYWRFIPKYSKITVLLTCLTCKGTAWDFSEKCHSAFTSLKQAFTTAPILAHWILGTPLILETWLQQWWQSIVSSVIPIAKSHFSDCLGHTLKAFRIDKMRVKDIYCQVFQCTIVDVGDYGGMNKHWSTGENFSVSSGNSVQFND